MHGQRIPPSVIHVLKPLEGAIDAQAHCAPYQMNESAFPMLASELS